MLRSLNLLTLKYNDRDHLNILHNNSSSRPYNLLLINLLNLRRLYKLLF